MTSPPSPPRPKFPRWPNRAWLAVKLGISDGRKYEVYRDIAQAATLRDLSYWLQVLAAAVIATLGLILNSPAVIIGAMLISPLMGPILSLGLGLAAGDFILIVRALVNLTISCALAIALAVGVVLLLPFREITAEIANRTQPNVLDLVVALGSGAIGTLSTCRPIAGVVTSIPGVAIAVALMPPLCVVGYGLGIALSLSVRTGLATAAGGGLLFLTNLAAITFMSMLVFLSIQVDTPTVLAEMEGWDGNDLETALLQRFLDRYPWGHRLRRVGYVQGRILVMMAIIGALVLPLGNSFERLRLELVQRQQQSEVQRLVRQLWQERLARTTDGQPRSQINRLQVLLLGEQLVVELTVISTEPLSRAEREDYTASLAKALGRSPETLRLDLIEVPTVAQNLADTAALPDPLQSFSSAEQQAEVLSRLEQQIQSLPLPQEQQLVDGRITLGGDRPPEVTLVHLGPRPLGAETRAVLTQVLQERLALAQVTLRWQHLSSQPRILAFVPRQAVLTPAGQKVVDELVEILKLYPRLTVFLSVVADKTDPPTLAQQRQKLIETRLLREGQIAPTRLGVLQSGSLANQSALQLVLTDP
jgi:uncharacterized hydrophobic protein (TIGR00271 family)